ncbi:MAG: 4'-phosphopantetheinyl transferase superfamily protein [Tetrasphaera sp.]
MGAACAAGEPEVLDAAERRREAAYRRVEDRDRFRLRASLLRRVVGDILGIAPRDVPVDRSCPGCGAQHGRAQIPGHPLHVSISKSADLAVVAVTALGPVGIDIERYAATVTDVAEHLLAPGETAGTPAELLALWCRKEALVKATGDGLTVPLTEIVAERGQPVRYPGGPLSVQLHDVDLAPGYASALAVLTDQPVLITRC